MLRMSRLWLDQPGARHIAGIGGHLGMIPRRWLA